MKLRNLVLYTATLICLGDASFAQGEYTAYGQSGFGLGYAHEVGRFASVTSLTAGACSNGKSDFAVSIGFDSRSYSASNVWGVGLRSFFKKRAERQLLFASFDLNLVAGDNAIFTVGGTGYGNLWTGKAGYFQFQMGEHLVFNPQGGGTGPTFSLLSAAGIAYLAPLSPSISLALEAGIAVYSGERYAGEQTTSGAVGASLVFPLGRSSTKGDGW